MNLKGKLKVASTPTESKSNNTSPAKNDFLDKEARKVKNQIDKLESRISQLENDIKKVESELALSYNNADANKHKMKKEELDKVMIEWESLQLEFETK
jgi:ATP-binding cassette subfamily F protein 3